MTGYSLPITINVAGIEYPIRYDFLAVLDILIAMNEPDFDDYAKGTVMLKILYPDWREIPGRHLEEALQKACDFIDCGQAGDKKHSPRLIDWEQDAAIIIPAVNSVAHTEVRSMPSLHWWTFFGYFLEIRESLLSSVISIRQKKAGHKKLESWEKEFYRENKVLIDFKKEDSEDVKMEKESIMKWL